MRIHELTFSAIGPYRERQRIDFDQLAGSGLYLINGPTGAGKSTIIDAIVFALYGRPSGDDSDEARLRSDFAAANEKTEVQLVFETAEGTFRVIRTPRYMRAQKRAGDALTPEPATCKLFRIEADGHEVELARNIATANAELQRRLGLSADQFLQTVVLPQGQFAGFLRARTAEREAILKRIFGTRLYEDVARLLKEDAQAARSAKDLATNEVREALVAIDAQVSLDAEAKQRMLDQVKHGLDDALMLTLQELGPALEEEAALRETEAAARSEEARAADDARTLVRSEAAALEASTRAQDAQLRAALAASSARAAIDEQRPLALSLGIAVDDDGDEQVWRGRALAAATAGGALQAALEAEQAVAAWPRLEQTLRGAIEALEDQAQAGLDRLAALPALQEEQQRIALARPDADELLALAGRKQALERETDLRRRIAAGRAGLPALEQQLAAAATAAADAEAGSASANRHFIEGLTATLAARLRPGLPCPVCGSLEHPQPSSATGVEVTAERVEALEIAARGAREAALRAEQALQHAAEEVVGLEAQVTLDLGALEAAQSQLASDELALEARGTAAAQATRLLEGLREERDALMQAAARLDTQLAVSRAEAQAKAEAHVVALGRAQAGRGSYDSVDARKQALRGLEQGLSTMADRLHDLTLATTEAEGAAAALTALPRHDGFADRQAAELAHGVASAAKEQADDRARDAQARLRAFRAGLANVAERCRRRAEIVADNADLVHLAELFNPGRGADSGLHIYVLQALFANVVEAANRRFEALLGGRFRLQATRDEGGDGRTLLGLGLAVQDGLTGKSRPATSLSGGETFCASLALALGLADVVRMGSGGIEIGSLFIDEGFGSLDPKPLEDVMTMLRQLGSHGRLVGLISHVPEMKTAIAERISVIQAGEDRTTELHVSWME